MIRLILRKEPSSDINVFYQIYMNDDFKKILCIILKYSDNQKIYNIFDAGANIGITSIFLSKNFPLAKIISIEPDKENFKQLVENIKLNELNLVYPLRAGLWKDNSKLKIKWGFRDNKSWSIQLVEDQDFGDIDGMTVMDIMKMSNFDIIDVFKLDIEGGERFLFEDAEIASSFIKRTRFLIIEIHDEYPIRENIISILIGNGMEIFYQGEYVIGVNSLLDKK